MSVHYWGESPFGVWTLEIQNEGRYLGKIKFYHFHSHHYSDVLTNDSNPNTRRMQSSPFSIISSILGQMDGWLEIEIEGGGREVDVDDDDGGGGGVDVVTV